MEKFKRYHLFSDPMEFYPAMIDDILSAKKYIYLETFRFMNDPMGERFRDALISKLKEKVEVLLLIDFWGGSPVRSGFFNELEKQGGKVRFFKKIKLGFDIFTKGHRRNHRKLLLIDDKITYIGSSNITGYNLNWRESVLRMTSEITTVFKRLFYQDFKIYNKYIFSRPYLYKTIHWENFEIIRDVPIITKKNINKKFIQLIKEAKKSIIIETPYFLPGFMLRKAMIDAAVRGVEIIVLLPKKSDVSLVDILRNKYLGPLSKKGVKFLFNEPHNLHAKLILIDKKIFGLGSSNFDYRSFRYMFEIMLFGNESEIVSQIIEHANITSHSSVPFVYEEWKKRPLLDKFFEWMLLPFRHLL